MRPEKLENKRLLAADVYGPAIPDHLDYTPPPKLMPIGYVSEVELPATLPLPTETGVGYSRGSLGGQDIYDEDFAAIAQDGVVTLREARDWLVGMDDHTGYNRFEIWMARAEVNDPANINLFTPKSFQLLTQVVNSPDFVYNNADFISVQDQTDELWWLLRVHEDAPPTLEETFALYSEDGITYTEMKDMITTATVDDNLDAGETALFNHMLEFQDMPEYVYYFTDSVVNGHYANNAGDTPSILVDKWFNGQDLPETHPNWGLVYVEVDMPLFVDGVSSSDPIQGNLDDCYVITAMSAIAHNSPETIENMIIEVDENLWVVRFYDGMEEVHYVTVDNQLPAWSGTETNVYARWNEEMWPALVEKAYVQATQNYYINRNNLGNSYQQVGWGDPSKAAEHIMGKERNTLKGMSESSYIAFMDMNIPLMVSYQSHTYHFESYNADTGVFFLRNPWGYSHIEATWEQLEEMPIVGSAYGAYSVNIIEARPQISNTRVVNTHQSLVYGIYYDPSEFIFREGRGSRLDRWAMEANRNLT